VQFLANPDAGETPEEMSLFERALEIREGLGDRRGAAESFFQIGLVHQIARQDEEAARRCFRRSYELADEVGDGVLMSYAIRHLGYLEQAAGNLDGAEAAFRESLQLREAAGWEPGVAPAQLALAAPLAVKNRAADARARDVR
jgi:tetratricopeptide (TPR) repeat protein